MEADNQKARKAKRREFNELVQELASFVRKRDKRVAAYQVRLGGFRGERAIQNSLGTPAEYARVVLSPCRGRNLIPERLAPTTKDVRQESEACVPRMNWVSIQACHCPGLCPLALQAAHVSTNAESSLSEPSSSAIYACKALVSLSHWKLLRTGRAGSEAHPKRGRGASEVRRSVTALLFPNVYETPSEISTKGMQAILKQRPI